MTCAKCGSNALKKVGWAWILAILWLGWVVIDLLFTALDPAE
jgi:hypothetical protein